MPYLDAEWHELLANFTPEQRTRHAAITLHLVSVGWTREGAANCLAVLRVVEEDERNKMSKTCLTEPVQSSVRKSTGGKDEPEPVSTA